VIKSLFYFNRQNSGDDFSAVFPRFILLHAREITDAEALPSGREQTTGSAGSKGKSSVWRSRSV